MSCVRPSTQLKKKQGNSVRIKNKRNYLKGVRCLLNLINKTKLEIMIILKQVKVVAYPR